MFIKIERPVWASNTNGKGVAPHRLVMQGDGNLVIYDSYSTATWSTGTNNYHTMHCRIIWAK